jgi:hypothetical protein
MFLKSAAVSLILGLLMATTVSAQQHPIVGKWQWTRDANKCTETYEYRADGSLHVESGAEITDNSYAVTPGPDAAGFYTITGKVLKTNGGQDCTEGPSGDNDKPYTIYVIFHRTEPLHLICYKPSLDECFGPLRRTQ